ncbi:MAG: RNA polymerase sigma factor [Planctomycetota bacterium]
MNEARPPATAGRAAGAAAERALPAVNDGLFRMFLVSERQPGTDAGPTRGRPRDEETDARLVSRCIEKDHEAWRELVDRYGGLVYSFPCRLGLGPADCDDVYQSVFTSLVAQLPRLRDRSSLIKWLTTTTRRVTWRHLERTRREAQLALEPRETEQSPEQMVLQWERDLMVRDALRELGGRCEALLHALFLDPDEPTYEVIARRLGIAPGTIGSSRSRCLRKLLDILRARRGVDDSRRAPAPEAGTPPEGAHALDR